jgi:hypothetical protein
MSPDRQEPSPARARADELVASSEWPHPSERRCFDCGHVWFAGERRHEYDIDHLDELPDDPAAVEVVCILCHDQRTLKREEAEEEDEPPPGSTRWSWSP